MTSQNNSSYRMIKDFIWPFILGFLTVVSLVLDAKDIAQLGMAWDWWQVLFFTLLMIAIGWLLVKYRKDVIDTISKPQLSDRQNVELSKGFLNYDDFEFYDSRESLSKCRPISKQLKSAETIWALWNTGTQAYVENVTESKSLERLLLPHPEDSTIRVFAKAVGKSEKSLIEDIVNITEEALKNGIQTRWFRGLTANTLMIGDPYSDKGWAHIETLFTTIPPNKRPSFRISRHQFPDLFETLLQAYLKIWDAKDTMKAKSDDNQSQT